MGVPGQMEMTLEPTCWGSRVKVAGMQPHFQVSCLAQAWGNREGGSLGSC